MAVSSIVTPSSIYSQAVKCLWSCGAHSRKMPKCIWQNAALKSPRSESSINVILSGLKSLDGMRRISGLSWHQLTWPRALSRLNHHGSWTCYINSEALCHGQIITILGGWVKSCDLGSYIVLVHSRIWIPLKNFNISDASGRFVDI